MFFSNRNCHTNQRDDDAKVGPGQTFHVRAGGAPVPGRRLWPLGWPRNRQPGEVSRPKSASVSLKSLQTSLQVSSENKLCSCLLLYSILIIFSVPPAEQVTVLDLAEPPTCRYKKKWKPTESPMCEIFRFTVNYANRTCDNNRDKDKHHVTWM